MAKDGETTAPDVDVAIVGYGPVGQTAAALLAGAGHRVAVYERYAEPYGLPRAVYFDDEAMRVWQSLGIVDELAADLLPATTYDWFGADGDPILRIRQPSPAPSGWEAGYLFFQPNLESALDGSVRALPSATVDRGWSAEALDLASDRVALRLRRVREPRPGELEPTAETRTIGARYLIGADGANSLVREQLGIAFEDLGFEARWLVVDLLPDDAGGLDRLDGPCQWCDPGRPHMHTRNGRRHRRFEFMLLPGEKPEDFAGEDAVWSLLEPWMTPRDGSIVRHTVYEFRGRVAAQMRRGRAVLAGDAAHTMPPFMAQGLCSGVRDAASLAWRLDLILRGLADERLLDSYATERRGQNEWTVNLSTEMGRVSCQLDPRAAAERDAAMREASTDLRAPERPPLGDGTLAPGAALAGTRAVQGSVGYRGRQGPFDDVVGRGFTLLSRRPLDLSDEQDRFLADIGARRAVLDEIDDLDGRLTGWLDEHGVDLVLVRPDFYVFGASATADEASALVDRLREQLTPAGKESP